MATYTQTVVAGAINQSQTFTASNGDASRMLTAMKAFFGKVPDGSGGLRDMTDAETIAAIFADNIATIKQRVLIYEQKAAQKASVDSIAPIVFT
jgi:hypothetical protein